jgi:hypothetical protein
MTTALALLAAGALLAAAVHCIRRAARRLDRIQRDTADNTPADRTPVGDDDWTRDMRRHIRHTAKRRNTGPRPRKEEL